MIDREKIVCAIENCIGQPKCKDCPWDDCEVEHEVVNRVPYGLLRDALALLKEQTEIVRCKDCKYRGNSEKCVLAAISEEKDFPLFILDNRGNWFCADGKRR